MKVKDYFCILLTLFSFFSLKLADKHFALVISISWLINFPLWYQMVLIEIRPSKQENFLAEKKNLLFLPCCSTLLALRCTFLPTKVLHATHKSYSFLFKFLETSPCRSRLLIIEFSSFAARQDNTDDI